MNPFPETLGLDKGGGVGVGVSGAGGGGGGEHATLMPVSFCVGAWHPWCPRGPEEKRQGPRPSPGGPWGTLTLHIQPHAFLGEYPLCSGVPELAGKILAVVSPLRLEGELALCGHGLGGQEGGGDSRLLQGPLQLDLVPRTGEIQRAGQSDFLGLLDFWRELDVR